MSFAIDIVLPKCAYTNITPCPYCFKLVTWSKLSYVLFFFCMQLAETPLSAAAKALVASGYGAEIGLSSDLGAYEMHDALGKCLS